MIMWKKEQYVKFSTIFNKYLCLSLSEDTKRFFEEKEELNEDQAEMRIAPNVRFKGNHDDDGNVRFKSETFQPKIS